ncbi:MAG: ribonuclease P protein component [Bacteroidales bacterium]|nr:ribonuclease P protein component [Bacteroidales bacterium]MDD3860642.1 ribonuclease P protein component [Bacteroidales bacterium]
MVTKNNFSFNRKSILRLKSEIQELFDNAERIDYGDFKVLCYPKNNISPGIFQVFISVPKKRLNKATDRNVVKRRIRESIRLNYQDLELLCINNSIRLFYGVIWNRDYICEYKLIEQNIVLSLQDIYNKIYEKTQNP